MISHSRKETEKLAKEFLAKLKPGKSGATVVGLWGELGAGKTAFTAAVAKNLGIKRKVASPTFVIMKKYPLSESDFKYLIHIDAYRLKDEKELKHIGWDEIIGDKEHLIFIEWPENIKKAMPKKHHKIEISHTKEGHRKFKIKKA